MDDMQIISRLIRFHRKRSGLSQSELAELAGIGKTVIYDIEKGKMTIRYTTLLKIFQALNINIKFESPLMNIFRETNYEKS